jgi:hypothetical protein
MENSMNKTGHREIAAFPELFDGMEQFIDELGEGIRRTGFRLAVVAIPGSAILLFALSRMA